MPVYASQLCEADTTPASDRFKEQFRAQYTQDAAYARQYDTAVQKLDAAEAAVRTVFDRLTAEIDDLEIRLAGAVAQSAAWQDINTQLITKRRELGEIMTYQCETLVPARNRLRSLDELLN